MSNMRTLKKIALAALAAALATLVGAGNASATILEIGGTAQNSSVAFTMSVTSGASVFFDRTDGQLVNECSASHLGGKTEVGLETQPTGQLSTLTFSSCTRAVIVHKAGKLYFQHIPGTTNGTVFSEEAEFTFGSPLGTVTCRTGVGYEIGTLTGKIEGNAQVDIKSVLDCGFVYPTLLLETSYEVTSPSGLGVLKEVPPPPPPTTLEVEGAPKNEKVELTSSLLSGSSTVLSRTDGSFANTCTASHANGSTESPYTGTKVTGPISSLSFSSCTRPVTVHKVGKLYIERIAGSTDGTLSSEEAEVTVGSPFGTLNCRTNSGVDIGRLTGKKEGNATIDIDAVLNCGFLVPSATWKGTYEVTSPSGLGVTE